VAGLDLMDNQYRQWGELPSETQVDMVRRFGFVIVPRRPHVRGGPAAAGPMRFLPPAERDVRQVGVAGI